MGIFDGLRITVDPDVGFEMQCFLLLHLFRHSVQLMHERGVTRLDQWYSDFVETDWRYVERFYQTARIPGRCAVRLLAAKGCAEER